MNSTNSTTEIPEGAVRVLDHGYVKLIETWGSDERIIESARMSTSGGFVSWDPYEGHPRGDFGLLSHLHENKHESPFEFGGACFQIMAPIMVFREHHRHRTQWYNEMSARYGPLPDVNYIPTVERLMINAGTSNKQAGTIKDAEELTQANAEKFRENLIEMYANQEQLYQEALKRGVPKELARVHLPVGRYSRMRAGANLRNWLGFLRLRMDKQAQWEIRQFANVIGDMIAEKFPKTWQLFTAPGPVKVNDKQRECALKAFQEKRAARLAEGKPVDVLDSLIASFGGSA